MHEPQIWHTSSVAEITKVFKTRKNGLKPDEIEDRLVRYGRNSFPHPRLQLGPFGIFLSQWESPLILLLVIAAVVALFVGEVVDALVIISTAFINVMVGFIQEYKANRALLELETYIEEWATVLRAGQTERILADHVVPGDILVLEAGDKVPADGRIIAHEELFIDESTLTGESSPVEKKDTTVVQEAPLAERANMCWQGTYIVRGTGQAIVTATGVRTEFGKIAELLRTTTEEHTSELQSLA
jgi:Ca2+-transporting ATPase